MRKHKHHYCFFSRTMEHGIAEHTDCRRSPNHISAMNVTSTRVSRHELQVTHGHDDKHILILARIVERRIYSWILSGDVMLFTYVYYATCCIALALRYTTNMEGSHCMFLARSFAFVRREHEIKNIHRCKRCKSLRITLRF